MAIKAKEWLKREGHIDEVTRGRISHANHALLQSAYEDGQRFSDWGPEKVAVMVNQVTDTETGETSERVTAHRVDGYESNGMPVEIAPYRYNHDTHVAYEDNADGTRGKRRSLREVCATDGVSLVQCTCGNPHVVARDGRGHVAVSIVAETSTPRVGNIWDLSRR